MLLEISNLNVSIRKKVLLKDINLKFNSGVFHALVGPNGAGKSTILRSISNLNVQITGKIELDGENLLALSRRDLAKKLSYMTQFSQNSNLNVQEVLSLGRRAFANSKLSENDHKKIKEISNSLRLDSWFDISIANLSGGERQKVLIASCLLQEPRILLLDEPISHLDPKNQHEMLEFVKKVTKEQNIITIVVLHDIHHALHYADTVTMLKNGEILSVKPSHEISSNDLKILFDMNLDMYEVCGHKFVYFRHSHFDTKSLY